MYQTIVQQDVFYIRNFTLAGAGRWVRKVRLAKPSNIFGLPCSKIRNIHSHMCNSPIFMLTSSNLMKREKFSSLA